MSFRIESDKYEAAYADFLREIREAIQKTFAEESERGLTQADLAAELDVHPSIVSRRLAGAGNITLRTISDLYTAMGREPLSNFLCPASREVAVRNERSPTVVNGTLNVVLVVQMHGAMSALPSFSFPALNFDQNFQIVGGPQSRPTAFSSVFSSSVNSQKVIDSTIEELING